MVIHMVCAIGIYALMWYKPQDVTEPIEFDVTSRTTYRGSMGYLNT